MNKEELIVRLFTKLNNEQIKYCVLRNYENLPRNSGNDIDVLIDPSEEDNLYVFLKEFANTNKWNVIRVWNKNNLQTFVLYCVNDVIETLKLDIWTKLSWRNISWIDNNYVLANSTNYGIFKIPNSGSEGAILLIKESFGKGKIPSKYKGRIQKLLLTNKNQFIEALYVNFGEFTNEIYNLCMNSKWDELDDQLRNIKFKLLMKSFLLNLLIYTKYNINYLAHKLLNLFKTQGSLIAFVGPDGSGKTTIISKLEHDLLNFYTKSSVFHTRLNIFPELKTGLGLSNPKVKETKNNKVEVKNVKQNKLSIVMNSIVVLYYYLEFIIGNFYLWILKKRGHFIMFDRYFYDFFIQPNTRNFIWKFKNALLFFIIKPNCIVHLYADPEIIYARKQELSVEEIREQNILFEKLFINNKNYYKIVTSTLSLDEVESNILKLILPSIIKNLEI